MKGYKKSVSVVFTHTAACVGFAGWVWWRLALSALLAAFLLFLLRGSFYPVNCFF